MADRLDQPALSGHPNMVEDVFTNLKLKRQIQVELMMDLVWRLGNFLLRFVLIELYYQFEIPY